jgi:hypothetical protein
MLTNRIRNKDRRIRVQLPIIKYIIRSLLIELYTRFPHKASLLMSLIPCLYADISTRIENLLQLESSQPPESISRSEPDC